MTVKQARMQVLQAVWATNKTMPVDEVSRVAGELLSEADEQLSQTGDRYTNKDVADLAVAMYEEDCQ